MRGRISEPNQRYGRAVRAIVGRMRTREMEEIAEDWRGMFRNIIDLVVFTAVEQPDALERAPVRRWRFSLDRCSQPAERQ
jgi:hypothetical protein